MKTIGMILAGGLGRRMGSTLPKVLHEVEGVPMVNRALDALQKGGIDQRVAILSHAAEQVMSVLPKEVEVVVQERPRGTASAVLEAQHYLEDDDTQVVVSFGDMPWLNPTSVRQVLDALKTGADAALLFHTFEDPPHFGRIIRDEKGEFVTIRQYKDCSPEELEIKELDAGLFGFRAKALRDVLSLLDDDNAAGELYLTDAPGRIVSTGGRVACVATQHIEEALGVNDKRHLEFANQIVALRRSESQWGIADEIYEEEQQKTAAAK